MRTKMKLMLCGMIFSAGMMAQEPVAADGPKKSPEERAENMTKRMTRELALTADQQQKVKVLVLEREREREKDREMAKVNDGKREAELKTILTAEQFEKYLKKKEEMKAKRQAHRGEPKEPMPPTPADPK